jgi:hypothetical protein
MSRSRPIWTLALGLFLTACPKPDHIELDPSQLTFTRKNQETWVHAIFKDHQGRSYMKQEQTWSSSDEKVATVDNKDKPGNVVSVGPGHATITVKGDDIEAEVGVTVTLVMKLKVSPDTVTMGTDGEKVPMLAQAFDQNNRLLKDRQVHGKCENEKVCNFDGENVWPAGDPGQTTLVLDVDDQEARIPVTVEKGKKH